MYSTESEPIDVIAEEIEREPAAAELYGPFAYDAEFVADYVARWKELQKKYRPDLLWVDHSPLFFKRWNTEGYDDPEIHHFRDACMKMIADYLNAGQEWGKQVYFNNKGNWPAGAGFRESDNMRVDKIESKWQNPATIGTPYGYLREEEENDAYKSSTELIHLLCDVVSKNGNLLLNIGPRGDGTIPEGMRKRLRAMGAWLATNGKAIYGTRPWATWGEESDEHDLRFTAKDDHLYVIALTQPTGPIEFSWPDDLPSPKIESVRLLGSEKKVAWETPESSVRIIPPENVGGKHAWVFAIAFNTDD